MLMYSVYWGSIVSQHFLVDMVDIVWIVRRGFWC